MSYLGNQPATGENNSFKILDDITSYTLTFDGASASIVSVADDTITKYEHRFITGQRVTYTHGGGTAIGGLTSGSVYYIVKNDQNTIKLAPSYADAIGSTNLINLSGLGVGTSHTLNVAFDGVNTKFKATYDNGTKAGITRAAQLQISINGVIQRPFDSVTPASGFGFDLDSVIVFSTAPASTDVFWGNLVANNFPTFDIADNDIDNFTGDAVTTSFTLSKTPANSQNILVTLDGVVQYPSDNDTTRAYTLSENVLTFDSAPGNGVFIQVRHIGFAGATSSEVTGFYGRTGNVALRHIDNVKVGNVESVGFSTFTATGIGTVKIGIGNTALLVDGEARVTGILTVGNSSITLDGTTNKITIGSDDTFIQNGAIGIGTTNLEGNALKVSGSTSITGNTTIGGNANIKSFDYAGISSSISETAYDVFVYDTSKDSDGGAWRKRTQHTSWYNTTNYEDSFIKRGSRKDFPAIAVLVASNNGLDIYDGDDPDLPLWMRFITNSEGPIYTAPNPGALAALNGIIFVGGNNGASGSFASEFGFIHDKMRLHQDSGKNQTRNTWITGMVQKTGGSSWVTQTSPISISNNHQLIDRKTNDISMTVLPNAPIDEVSGLPRPTIAVATDGGVSVIKDDGNVYDITDTSANWNYFRTVNFTPNYKLIINGSFNGTENNILHVCDIPSADVSQNTVNNRITSLNSRYYHQDSSIPNTKVGTNYTVIPQETEKNNLVLGSQAALNFVAENPESQNGIQSDSMVAYATTSYNTGWMHGNIKGAFLSDTDATNLSGSELVTNGTFTSNYDNWSAGNGATLSIVSNALRVTYNGVANPYAVQEISGLTVGKTYVASVDIVNISAGEDARMVVGTTATATGPTSGNFTTTGTITVTFTAEATSHWMKLQSLSNAAGEYAEFDNASLRLADPDRSINNKGLAVYGTVTKSAVATGAELVAYSGFSNSNYLLQPYNSDLNWDGSSTWSISFWVYFNSNNVYDLLIAREQSDGTGNRWHIDTGSNNSIGFKSQASSRTVIPGDSVFGVWRHICFTQEGSLYRAFRDGVQQVTYTGSDNFYNTSAELKIGINAAGGNANGSRLALVRLSNSVPSPEQIKKMYEDEKVLFQENAACTLYGSSDAVTALAYDDKEELLHVGTSSGRSDFRGLRRINNTETAVTTAISAYDGLIAQQ